MFSVDIVTGWTCAHARDIVTTVKALLFACCKLYRYIYSTYQKETSHIGKKEYFGEKNSVNQNMS